MAIDRDEDGTTLARVTKRLKDTEGRPIGFANDNQILDTQMYEVEYSNGYKKRLAANKFAKNLFSKVDAEGNHHVLFDKITDYHTDGTEVKQQDAFTTNSRGVQRWRETTVGWEMLVQWKYGSTTWVSLKDMKEEYPVQAADYAVENRVSLEPEFVWWASYVLMKRNQIIANIKCKDWVLTHKYGIEVPDNSEQAKPVEKKNGNTL